MAKTTGLAVTTLSVDDSGGTARAIKNDFTNFSISTPRAVQDVTGVDKSAIERLLLLADVQVELDGVFDSAATTSAHAVFSTVPSTAVNRTTTIVIPGTVTATFAAELLYTDYNITRAASGELTFKCPGVLADGNVSTIWS